MWFDIIKDEDEVYNTRRSEFDRVMDEYFEAIINLYNQQLQEHHKEPSIAGIERERDELADKVNQATSADLFDIARDIMIDLEKAIDWFATRIGYPTTVKEQLLLLKHGPNIHLLEQLVNLVRAWDK